LLVLGNTLTVTTLSSQLAVATDLPFVRNPLVDAAIHEQGGEPHRIDISTYSAARGFDSMVLNRGDSGFEAALVLLADRDALPPQLQPRAMLALWAAGLLILPQELASHKATAASADTVAAFRSNGFADLPCCIPVAMCDALFRHYRQLRMADNVLLNDPRSDRQTVHNDPAGRILQQMLAPLAAAIIRKPIKSSYSFASLYRGGAELRVHRDRLQCEYTLSLLIEHSAKGADEPLPWPLQLYPKAGTPPIECHQRAGGGLFFRGRDIPHGRRPLPADENYWVLLLHYVDANFDGSLD